MENRIKEISEMYCPEYPGIRDADTFERLWAIESYLKGVSLANAECHKMIKILGDKLGLAAEDIEKIWTEEIHSKDKK